MRFLLRQSTGKVIGDQCPGFGTWRLPQDCQRKSFLQDSHVAKYAEAGDVATILTKAFD